jgi:hypothetical protein
MGLRGIFISPQEKSGRVEGARPDQSSRRLVELHQPEPGLI